jgi:Mrp family chromosome partitioning ATPase
MASMMNIPVLGMVENMSYVKCPDCGKEIKLFGESNLDKVAATYNLPVLARLPIDPAVASAVDAGAVEDIDVSLMDNAVTVIEGR